MSIHVGFGVCRLSVVPVYELPDYHSQQYNQLLFGEHYQVTGSKGAWFSIQLAFDNSGGWIHQTQHHEITAEYFEQINLSDYKITTDISSTLLYHKSTVHIVMGSIVPFSNSELFKAEEQLAFNGESKSLSQKRDAEFLNTMLKKYTNVPFCPGGKSPFGMDHSGIVQMIYKICGYKLPRNTEHQLKTGQAISNFTHAVSGDIIFLKNSSGESQPALLLSGSKVLLMDGYSRIEKVDSKGVKTEGQKKYGWEIQDIRRIIV